nr:hypothetical protein [Pandoravirus aubagnensis]
MTAAKRRQRPAVCSLAHKNDLRIWSCGGCRRSSGGLAVEATFLALIENHKHRPTLVPLAALFLFQFFVGLCVFSGRREAHSGNHVNQHHTVSPERTDVDRGGL